MESTGEREKLQREIAAMAARLIVEEGRDSAQAKRKAALALAGNRARSPAVLPDKEQMDRALRAYLRTVVGAPHAAMLRRRRTAAVHWMQILEAFRPHLVGAVLDGSATEHAPIKLNLYTESAKDVELALLERGIDFRVTEASCGDGHAQEVIGFLARSTEGAAGEPPLAILLTVYEPAAQRIAPSARSSDPLLHPIERRGRADIALLRQLLDESDAGAGLPGTRE